MPDEASAAAGALVDVIVEGLNHLQGGGGGRGLVERGVRERGGGGHYFTELFLCFVVKHADCDPPAENRVVGVVSRHVAAKEKKG